MPDWETLQRALQNWTEAASGLPDTSVVWSQQTKARPPALAGSSAIVMRISNIAELGLPEERTEDNLLAFTDKAVTLIDVAGNALTIPAHGLTTGVGPVLVHSSTSTPPPPLLEAKNYWAVALDVNRIRVADTFEKTGGGDIANPVTPVVLTGAGTGTLVVQSTASTTDALAGLAISRTLLRVTLELKCHSDKGTGSTMATSILQKVRGRRALPSVKQILRDQNIGMIGTDHVRAVQGIRDALLFEPRAYLDVHVLVSATESEAQSIIRAVQVTNQSFSPPTTITVTAG